MISYKVDVFNSACVSNLVYVLGLALSYITARYNGDV